ncbi:helix-turn-helix transcriptional regulator [Solihabitans fulvus]|uniref:Helix-turn-helix transcriptional regulator n=1 Tax=Solihabitans fulvus TaxID=1892852 RepID=A0A5B2WTP5_9PSEU|nr:helix-turn-helix transcriptional regulator [Solihabitans fulvus]KAA2253906.1 helix-turn-helix transcriptional regulator [Solihabitans fulvus]
MTAPTAPTAFASTLRDWRTRRRLSQLELALRAGTTQRHLSFIEMGRSRPGRDMVVRLAESLELPLRERNTLLHTAGFAPVYPQTAPTDPGMRPVMAALRQVLDGHQPYPAIVTDRYGETLAVNAALGVLTEGCDPVLVAPGFNALRLALHPDGMAPRIVNLDQWGRHITERLRQEIARNPDDRLADLLAELEGYLADHPIDRGAGFLGFAVPLRLRTEDGELRLLTTLATFGTGLDVTLAELMLEAFLPADEATAEVLRRRAA